MNNGEKVSPNNEGIPDDFDIFYCSLQSFYPKGKTKWSQLTQQEQQDVMNQYRFSPLRPGQYQDITGINNQD